MPILPFKWVKIGDGVIVRLSQHFCYTDFGVRESNDQREYGRRYINTGAPGTGFIERETESRSYGRFVNDCLKRQKPSYFKMLFGLEPNYKHELVAARHALDEATDPLKNRILDSYVNALSVGEVEEQVERLQRGVKDRIKRHHHNKYYTSILSHYKHKVHQLERDMVSVQLDVKDTCTPEQYASWLRLVEAFVNMASCRRIWNQKGKTHSEYEQVFFDLGVFDFLRAECFLPVMRTCTGVDYYILPTSILVARSSVDFDVVPIRDVNIVCQEMAIQETIEVLNSRLGDAASMLYVPKFDQRWYFNHVRPIMHFVGAYDELKALQ